MVSLANRMKGVQYLVDKEGNPKSVLIDLEAWGDIWETMEDIMVVEERKDEATISWDEIKRAEDAIRR